MGFEPEIQDKVTIPAYSGSYSYTYAKPVGEGD
jgi:hypothetical protein